MTVTSCGSCDNGILYAAGAQLVPCPTSNPPATTNGHKPKSNGRYDGRILDVRGMLAQPEEPIPWRCEGLAADGFLTTITGCGGEGKSWLALTLACGVGRGEAGAGIRCTKGRTVIFDAENGPKLTIRRFRAADVGADLDVQPVDAGGLRITTDLAWFRKVIEEQRANLVIFDSLRVLSSGVKENDSDVLEPLITALKQLARETGASVVLIHHRGKAEGSEYRGTSVILDQTDLLFTLGRVPGDPEGRHRRKLTTVKCRIDEEPQPRWVAIETDRAQGLVYVNEAEPYEEQEERERPRDQHRGDVLELLGGIARSGRSIAKNLDLSEPTVRRILGDLENERLAEKTPDGWVRHRVKPLGGDAGDALSDGFSKPNPMRPICSCVDAPSAADDGRCSRCFGWPS
jgi:AAA domain